MPNDTQGIFLTFFFFNYCCIGGTLWHLPKFLQCIIIEFTSLSFFYSLPHPHFWKFQQVPFFHLYTWVRSISSFLHTFPTYPPPQLVPTARQELYYLLVLHFWKKHFYLSKIAIQGVLLWQFMHVCIITWIGLFPLFFFLP
jgi:hypothetical protein